MIRLKPFLLLILFFLVDQATAQQSNKFSFLKTGDILFQTNLSGQGLAISLATKSIYTHCGYLVIENGQYWVYEAVQPVKKTLLASWIGHGTDGKFVAKRLKNILNFNFDKLAKEGDKYLGRNYDLYFGWGEDRIYCSELVWKVFNHVGNIELGKLQALKEFDLSNPIVKAKLKERYGENIPYNEKVISPSAIFESFLLELVPQP